MQTGFLAVAHFTGAEIAAGAANNLPASVYVFNTTTGVLTSVLSVADRQRLEAFMANHWAHKATLPSGHAYKIAHPLTVLATY